MQKLNNNGSVEPYAWQKWSTSELNADVLSGGWLFPADMFETALAAANGASIGLWLTPEDDIETLETALQNAKVLAIEFPVFADGRGFSQARWAKSRFGFKGEIHAVGAFMQDQLHYLKRCGFDGFIVNDDAKLESLRLSLNDFSDGYQASAIQPTPLFRRR